MEEIAEEAGFIRAALYARFGSKEDLFRAVLDSHSTRAAERFAAMATPSSPIAGALEAAEIFRHTTTLGRVPLDLELRLDALRNPKLRQRVGEVDRSQAEKMTELIEHNMKGTKRRLNIPAEDLADIGLAAVSGLMQYAALDEINSDRFRKLVEELFALLTGPYKDRD
jgi:AcrR family transcriptional regulator